MNKKYFTYEQLFAFSRLNGSNVHIAKLMQIDPRVIAQVRAIVEQTFGKHCIYSEDVADHFLTLVDKRYPQFVIDSNGNSVSFKILPLGISLI